MQEPSCLLSLPYGRVISPPHWLSIFCFISSKHTTCSLLPFLLSSPLSYLFCSPLFRSALKKFGKHLRCCLWERWNAKAVSCESSRSSADKIWKSLGSAWIFLPQYTFNSQRSKGNLCMHKVTQKKERKKEREKDRERKKEKWRERKREKERSKLWCYWIFRNTICQTIGYNSSLRWEHTQAATISSAKHVRAR